MTIREWSRLRKDESATRMLDHPRTSEPDAFDARSDVWDTFDLSARKRIHDTSALTKTPEIGRKTCQRKLWYHRANRLGATQRKNSWSARISEPGSRLRGAGLAAKSGLRRT
jgi:hypothetical protein